MPVADLGGGIELSVTVTAAEDKAAVHHGFVPAVAKVLGQLGFKSHLNRLRKPCTRLELIAARQGALLLREDIEHGKARQAVQQATSVGEQTDTFSENGLLWQAGIDIIRPVDKALNTRNSYLIPNSE